MENYKTTKKYYTEVLNSGMFFEFYPTLTGDWEIDKVKWKFIHKHQIFDEQENSVQISINREPSFTEIWYEGFVELDGEKYQFWLIHPQGVDPHGNEYEVDVRWFFARVPRQIRGMLPYIIDAFKQKQHDSRDKENRS